MILSHSFHFVKCGYTVFSPFFCGFCHLSHRPGTTSGVARKIGTGDARGKDKRLLFSVSGGKSGRRVVARIFPSTLVSRSLSANAPGGRPYSPENARSPSPLCRGDHPSPARLARTSCPHVSPVKQRAKEGDAAAPPSKRVLFDVRILSDVRARLFTTRARAGRAAFHAPRVTPPRGR